MPEPVNACPLCGTSESRPFDRREFRGFQVINRLCTSCGLVFQSPRMSEGEAADFYAREYRQLYEGSGSPTAFNLAVQQGRAEALGQAARQHLASVRSHLDIGCSTGTLLKYFKGLLGCLSTGIEPGEAHLEQARKDGLKVFPSLETLRQDSSGRFDLVSLIHVLEHLADPVGYLTALRADLLEPGGCLLLEVPNLYAHDSFEVAHLVSYSPHTLRLVLEKAGYKIEWLQVHGHPRSELLPLYITLLARPSGSSASFWKLITEHNVALKRRSGMLRRRILERLLPAQAWKM